LAVIAGIAFLGVALISFREMALDNNQLRHSYGKSLALTLEVKSDPVASQAKVIGSYRHDSHFSFLATAIQIEENDSVIRLRLPVRVIADGTVRGLLPGQKIRVTGTVEKTSEVRVAALFLIRNVQDVSKPSSWSKALGQIRSSFREIAKDGNSGALIPGMVLGDTSLQSQEFTNSMRKSGLAHLTAVSGANFALVAALLLWLSQWLIRRIWLRMSITALILLSFIALVRPSPSVLRAAAMAAVILLAKGTGRQRESVPALGFAIAAVILIDPWQSRDPGFALSVLATAGLLLLSPLVCEKLSHLLPIRLAEALAPPISAIALCTPILVAISGFVAPISIFANVLAAPLVAPITVIGFIAALMAPLWAGGSGTLVYLIKFPASAIVMIAEASSRFPVITTGKGLQGFFLALIASCVVAFAYKNGDEAHWSLEEHYSSSSLQFSG
jgi:competence protein ComEC